MLRHLLGWKTSRKIIVFESDDWGSFRFKNKAIRDKYIPAYDPKGWMHYNDCFESHADVNSLSEVLKSVRDSKQRPACFTFLMNPANPDFKKIKKAHFMHFYSESFLETLSKRKDGKNLLKWYQKALSERFIEVGFHGREHLNQQSWMADLQAGDVNTLQGFEDRIWGQSIIKSAKAKKHHRSTYKIKSYSELAGLKQNIKEGVELLNKTFHQNTTYFLPPDGPYHLSLNKTLVENGIQFIGLAKVHNNPLEPKWFQKKAFWLGKPTKEGLRVITRNVIFEPSSPRSTNWVKTALKGIEDAFKYKNPAVISTHRANYTGSLNVENRVNSLNELKILLDQILTKWPEVEFMTSSELGRTIEKK